MAIRSVKEMMTAARAEIGNLSPEETKRRVDEEGALIVDIREAHELDANGVIPGALHAPRSLIEFMICRPAAPQTRVRRRSRIHLPLSERRPVKFDREVGQGYGPQKGLPHRQWHQRLEGSRPTSRVTNDADTIGQAGG